MRMGDRLNWLRIKNGRLCIIDVEPLDFATTKLVKISVHLFTNSDDVRCHD
jgi:hypothetical protein